MAYTSTSIEEILGKVIRNLDNKLPGHYADSILEWIPEAVIQMRTTHTLFTSSTPNVGCQGEYVTENHAIRLPCGLVEILSVEDEYGQRIHRSGAQLDISNPSRGRQGAATDSGRTTDFNTNTDSFGTGSEEGPSIPWDGSNITTNTTPVAIPYYDLQLDYLLTSEESMFVKIHYKGLPVDERGYALIPNVEEFKEALYWWVIFKLMGTGFQHPVIPLTLQGLDYCEKQYEKFAGRALGEIKMPDQDRMQKLYNATVRLIPPTHFYGDFFTGSEQIQPIKGI